MTNLENLKNELINQKNILQNKNYSVNIANSNPSPAEITSALNNIIDNDPNVTTYANYYKLMISPEDYNITFTNLTFPSEITKIRGYAFCESGEYIMPTTLTIPSNIKQIGDQAFAECAMTNLVFEEGVESIGSQTFRGCPNLLSVTFPNSLTSVGNSCFTNSTNIMSISFGSGLETLEYGCFRVLNNIQTVTIPSTVKTIASYNFYNCPSLLDFYFEGDSITINNSNFLNTHNTKLKIWVKFSALSTYYNLTNLVKVADHLISSYTVTSGSFPTISGLNLNWYATIDDAVNKTNALSAPTINGTYYCKVV